MPNMTFTKKNNTEVKKSLNTWKIIIADDEEDIHLVTKTVLKNFTYDNRALEFISTYNCEDTIKALKEHDDIALILLDVVMDSDDAGLKVAKRIRDELKNNIIQIVLRTGQPGSAPETDVVINYAINDYKEKTELTSKKLITTIVTALRSYKTLKALEGNKKGLKKIIKASESLYNKDSCKLFTEGILTQLISILKLNHDAILVEHFDGLSLEKNKNNEFSILNTTGTFKEIKDFENIENDIKELILDVSNTKKGVFKDTAYIGYLEIDKNISNIIYLSSFQKLDQMDKNLIEILFNHSNIAFNNINLNEEMFTTQKILIEVLGEVIEKRYIDDPFHIKRVAQMSYVLGILAGLSQEEATTLKMVSPMHDVGKIGIRDSILLKPKELDSDEYEEMKKHTTIGYNILTDTNKETLNIAAIVAYEHHEKWNGSGYPRGLKEEEISIYGRITTLVDVYDALANKRCYKEPWEMDAILEYLNKEKGQQFDPNLVDLFLNNLDKFIEVQEKYKS